MLKRFLSPLDQNRTFLMFLGKVHFLLTGPIFYLTEISEFGISSDYFFDELEKFPESIAIVGSGYVGLEFAGFFSTLGIFISLLFCPFAYYLGAKVDLLYRKKSVLNAFDSFLSESLLEEMKSSVNLVPETTVSKVILLKFTFICPSF